MTVKNDATSTSSRAGTPQVELVLYHSPFRRETRGLSSVQFTRVPNARALDGSTEHLSSSLAPASFPAGSGSLIRYHPSPYQGLRLCPVTPVWLLCMIARPNLQCRSRKCRRHKRVAGVTLGCGTSRHQPRLVRGQRTQGPRHCSSNCGETHAPSRLVPVELDFRSAFMGSV